MGKSEGLGGAGRALPGSAPRSRPGLPELSVIIASYNARQTIEKCLDSLRLQKSSRTFETILVDSSTDGTADLVRQRYPEVRLITSRSRLFCGSARNVGLKVAQAPIIAFLDADCFVEPGWVDAVLAAQSPPHYLVSGVVLNGTPERPVAWAYYFCEFSHWLPGGASREIREAAGCCLSFQREAYEAYGPFIEGTYSSDTAFHWRTWRDGHKVYLDPAIRVFHRTQYTVREYLSHVAYHRRCYARVKRRETGLGLLARLAHVMLTPALPFLLVAAIGTRVISSRRFIREFLGSLPLLFAGLCARAGGEFLGFLICGPETPQDQYTNLPNLTYPTDWNPKEFH
jgi:GT2 family glycosyltransferase